LKQSVLTRTAGLGKQIALGAFLALLVVSVAACGDEATPAPLATLAPTAIPTVAPTIAPTASPTATPEPTATSITTPDATAIPTVIPTTIPKIDPTPSPTTDPTVAIKAEVAATVRQFGQALSTGDTELLASLFLQSEKTNSFSNSEPLRINGWPGVEGSFKGLLSLPPGSVSLLHRQGRIDLLSDEAALWTGHFILNIRPPEQPRQTVEGRITAVLQKVDGKWLRVHMHTSELPP
jgi:hypothetical protein